MRSTRVLTFLLVVLVLVPAGILGWLGIQGADRFRSEVRQRIGQEMDAIGQVLGQLTSEFVADEARDADARVAATAQRLALRLPLEPVGRALADAETSLAVQGGAGGGEFDRLWDPAAVDLRILDGASRPVLPVPFEPDGGAAGRSDPQRLFDDLAREADAAAYGRGELARALEVWRSAAARFTEPAWRARAEVEAALLTSALVRPAPDADALLADLEARFTASVLARLGRPWVLLLLRGDPPANLAIVRLRELLTEGRLAEVPLTELERARVEELVETRGRWAGAAADGGRDVRRAPLPGGLVLEVSRRWPTSLEGPASLLIRRWKARVPFATQATLVHAPAPIRFPAETQATVLWLPVPNYGGPTTWGLLGHREEARLLAEVASSRRFTIIGVLSLVGVIGLGLLVGRSALAREREARRLKDDFLANVSHELRTPLTSVCLHADLLAESGLAEPQRRAHAEVVRAEGARLSALVDDLLDFAALERGSRRLEPEPVDLGAAAERAVAPFRVLADREGVTLTLERAPGEILALADPHALGRIFSNLVGNAWKHGRPSRDGGPGRLVIRAGVSDGRPTVDVVDDGPGIPTKERSHLFERFRRGASAGKTRGVGLGLALSRDLARALGGDLSVVEDPARTVFRLTLPPVPPAPPEFAPEVPA